jgi:hypothetical protein
MVKWAQRYEGEKGVKVRTSVVVLRCVPINRDLLRIDNLSGIDKITVHIVGEYRERRCN